MAKKLLSEQVVNRWAKLSGVKLNENYGAPMSGEREDEMGAGEQMTPVEDTGIEMADEIPPMEEPEGDGMSITKEDDELMAMLEKAVENVLVRMGLGDEGESDEGGDEVAGPDTDMEDVESDEEEGGEDEETLDEELEVVSDDEIINETLKRVIRRLVG
jgi:hypothetical protein